MEKSTLVNRIKSLYKERQQFASSFDNEVKAFEEKKKGLVEAIENGTEFKDFENEMEFVLFRYEMQIRDLNTITTELIHLYKLALAYSLREEFDEEMNKVLLKLLEKQPKTTYVVTEKGIREREKGLEKKQVEQLKNSPLYKQILESLKQKLS